MDRPLDKVLRAAGEVREVRTRRDFRASYNAVCPCHDDHAPSVEIDEKGDGTVLVLCRVCGKEATGRILEAWKLTAADLFPQEDAPPAARNGRARHGGRVVATFDYRDQEGVLLYQAVRVEPGKNGRGKDFFQRRPVGGDQWAYNLDGVRRVLYRLPELLEANPEAVVYVPEGEAKVDALRALGQAATCCVGGAKKWLDDYNPALRGRTVVLLPDNDAPGREHAALVAKALAGVAEKVVTLELPGLPAKGDVLDWLAAGGTRQNLEGLTAAALEGEEQRPVFLTYANVKAERVPWLWQSWLPLGNTSILDGDPGLGKSLLTVDLAARVSRGWRMPPLGGPGEGGGEPAGVLLLNAEDDAGYTIRPRLDAAGADPGRVHSLEAVRHKGESRPPVLPWDLDLVGERVRAWKVRLVVVDPLMAYLGGDIDAHKDQDVRRCLRRLKDFAKELNVAMLVLRHLNKLSGGPALYRGGSSIGIVGAARCAWIVGRDPDDQRRHVLAMNKTNIGPTPDSISYFVRPHENGTASIEWEGASTLKPHQILGHPGPQQVRPVGRPPQQITDAADWLAEYLRLGPEKAADVKGDAKKAGFSPETLKRARKQLGVRTEKWGATWMWIPPGSVREGQEGAGDDDESDDE